MKALVFALVGVSLYATQQVVMEQRLAKFTPAAVVMCFGIVGIVLGGLFVLLAKSGSQPIVWPTGSGMAWALAAGVIFFFADFFYVSSYGMGGDLFVITATLALIPVISILMKVALTGHRPNGFMIMACAAGVLAVILAAKGMAQMAQAAPAPTDTATAP